MDQVTRDLPTLMAEKIVEKMISFMTTIAIILNIPSKTVEVVLDLDHPCVKHMINNCVCAVLQMTVENLPSHAALHASRCDLIKFMSFKMFGLTVQQLSDSVQQFPESNISNYNKTFWEAVEEAKNEYNPVEPSSAENAFAAPSSEENAK